MILDIILLVVGFIIFLKETNIFVDDASSITDNFQISEILIELISIVFPKTVTYIAVTRKG